MEVDPAVDRVLRHRSFSVRSVVGGACRVWFTSLHHLLVIGVVFLAPAALLTLIPGEETRIETRVGLVVLASIPLSFLMQGAIVAFVFQRRLGERPRVFASIRSGLARTFAVLSVALITGFAIGVLMLFVGVLVRAFSPLFGLLNLLLIPLFVSWSVAIPAAVVEKLPATSAIARSMHLTKGARLKIFGAFLMMCALFYALEFVILLPLMLALRGVKLAETTWFFVATAMLLASFVSVWPAVVYHELRETKEGIGLEQLASVFQ